MWSGSTRQTLHLPTARASAIRTASPHLERQQQISSKRAQTTWRQLALYPWQEQAHRQLILAQ